MNAKNKNIAAKIKELIRYRFAKPEDEEYVIPNGNSYSGYILTALLAACIFILYYRYSLYWIVNDIRGDLFCHVNFASDFFDEAVTFKEAWLRCPHCFWHLCVRFFDLLMDFPLNEAAAFTNAVFGLFAFFVTTYMSFQLIKFYTGKTALSLSAVSAFMLALVGPFEKLWYADIYIGQFSPNPFHNPTHMAVKCFGLLAVMLGVDIFREYKHELPIFFMGKGKYLGFGVSLFFSVATKPTFMFMLLPAGFLYFIVEAIVRGIKKETNIKEVWAVLWRIIVATVPSLCYLALEYFAFFDWVTNREESTLTIGGFLDIWHLFAYDVPTSILLGMFFPIWMVVTNPGYFFKTTEGRLSLTCYLVGVFEFAFIVEAGEQAISGNFAWCMMSGMTVLFAFSVIRLLVETLKKKFDKCHAVYIIISWFLLLLHVYSGLSFMNPFGYII